MKTTIEAVRAEATRRAAALCAACRPTWEADPSKRALLKRMQLQAFDPDSGGAFEKSLTSCFPSDFECSEEEEEKIVSAYVEAGVAEVERTLTLG